MTKIQTNELLPCIKNYSSIHTAGEVVTTLELLHHELLDADIASLSVFNHIYLIITRNLETAIYHDMFENSDIVATHIVDFASLYFQALEGYVLHTKIPKAWEITFQFYKNKTSFQMTYLVLAANAHINADLPIVLANLTSSISFQSDYKQIQRIIFESLPEILAGLRTYITHSYVIERRLIWLYPIGIKIIMSWWRVRVWITKTKLFSKKTTRKIIDSYAGKTASRIILFTKIISTNIASLKTRDSHN